MVWFVLYCTQAYCYYVHVKAPSCGFSFQYAWFCRSVKNMVFWSIKYVELRTNWSWETSILQHVNGRPNVAKPVKTHLETLKWEVLPNPTCSPDIAPSNYHLFRSMTHGLPEQCFNSYEDTKKWIDSWITSKDDSFFWRGIRILPERWKKLVASDGQYLEWSTGNHFLKIKS